MKIENEIVNLNKYIHSEITDLTEMKPFIRTFYPFFCFDETVTLIFYKKVRLKLIVYLLQLYVFFIIR